MLPLALDPAVAEPPYRQIARQLAAAIARGELAPGDRLPPVRVLAGQLDVNPNTVARAYAELGQAGLIVARRGGGTVVAARARERSEDERRARLRAVADRALAQTLALGFDPDDLAAAVALAAAGWRAGLAASGPPATHRAAPATTRPAGLALRFVGSHDLAVTLLATQLASARPPVALETTFAGSLDGLMALARGDADLAGCHLLDAASGEYNVPFVRRLLPGQDVLLVRLATRVQGFIVRPDLRPAELSVAEIARRGWRFANRQRGSGTRVLFDHLLRQAGLPPGAIAGYGWELPSHLAVADAVARGEADVGLGIRAAAEAYGLAFVPCAAEPYELALRAVDLTAPAVQALLAALGSPPLRRLVGRLSGYDGSAMGEVRHVA